VGKLAPTLLQLKSDRVYHFGKSVPKGSSGPDDASLVKSINGPILVGDFTHADGTQYVLCVNKDFTANTPCHPQFRTSVKKLEFISPYTGAPTPYEGEQTWLAPGQGVLLKLTR
jgi:hypothetical protein